MADVAVPAEAWDRVRRGCGRRALAGGSGSRRRRPWPWMAGSGGSRHSPCAPTPAPRC